MAKLELWLQQANVAFEPDTLDADMQQVVEEELAGCQVRQAGRASEQGLPSHPPPAKVGQRALKAAVRFSGALQLTAVRPQLSVFPVSL